MYRKIDGHRQHLTDREGEDGLGGGEGQLEADDAEGLEEGLPALGGEEAVANGKGV